MKTCIIKSHLSTVWTQMGTHSTGTNRKTVGEQLHFSKRVIAALHNELLNSFPTLANEDRQSRLPSGPTVVLLLASTVSQAGRVDRTERGGVGGGIFDNVAAEPPQSKNGLNLRGWLRRPPSLLLITGLLSVPLPSSNSPPLTASFLLLLCVSNTSLCCPTGNLHSGQ